MHDFEESADDSRAELGPGWVQPVFLPHRRGPKIETSNRARSPGYSSKHVFIFAHQTQNYIICFIDAHLSQAVSSKAEQTATSSRAPHQLLRLGVRRRRRRPSEPKQPSRDLWIGRIREMPKISIPG
ncbi:hypothetical protein CDEST_05294 [Colletotrichum destructivum]|uniref:Uncharacterized protein n=1 Tax=Colletotrichum destructivum TaxID=34406 RepID=A0AAX4IBA5_9PEZI|nr:hypothetical protein CDEST_05294 [Colletotrichum destructivum]